MQQIRFIQRNFTTTLKCLQEKDIYQTIPEKLRDFEARVNSNCEEGWRLHSVIPELINGTSCVVLVLTRDV